jgi:sugar phosphate permease
MLFNFYSNSFSSVSKGFAKGLFVTGLLVFGFGLLVWIFRQVLAVIAAAIFMAVGVGCCLKAIRIYYIAWKSGRHHDDDNSGRSPNVRIHIE